MDLSSFRRAEPDPEEIYNWVVAWTGACISVRWPPGFCLKVCLASALGLTERDVGAIQSEYLCCEEQLTVIGAVHAYVEEPGGGEIAALPVEPRIVVLCGSGGRIYCYHARDGELELHWVATTLEEFLDDALRKYEHIYYLLSLDHLDNEFSLSPDPLRFVETHFEASFPIPWPVGTQLHLGKLIVTTFVSEGASRRLFIFAFMTGNGLPPNLREAVLCLEPESGRVYAYNPFAQSLLHVVNSVRGLFVFGLWHAVHNTRFDHPSCRYFRRELPPVCPHVPVVSVPKPICNVDSAMRCLYLSVSPWVPADVYYRGQQIPVRSRGGFPASLLAGIEANIRVQLEHLKAQTARSDWAENIRVHGQRVIEAEQRAAAERWAEWADGRETDSPDEGEAGEEEKEEEEGGEYGDDFDFRDGFLYSDDEYYSEEDYYSEDEYYTTSDTGNGSSLSSEGDADSAGEGV